MLHTHSYCNKRAIKFLVPLTLFLPFEELCHLQILYAVLCTGGTGGNVTAQESHIVTNSTFFSLRNPNSHLKTNRTCNCHQKFSNLTPRVLTDKNYIVEALLLSVKTAIVNRIAVSQASLPQRTPQPLEPYQEHILSPSN